MALTHILGFPMAYDPLAKFRCGYGYNLFSVTEDT